MAGRIHPHQADLQVAQRIAVGGIGAHGPVRMRSAHAISPAEHDLLREQLGTVLGRTPELEIEVDPALLAGLELDAPHAIVRNHFQADLDRITAELTRHG